MSEEWTIVARTRDRLGESAMWHVGEQALYWIDWYGPMVRRLYPASGRLDGWNIPGAALIGTLVLAGGGRLLLALEGGLFLFDPASGRQTRFADPNQGRPGVAYNDGKLDRCGRLWIGTFDVAESEPRGILHCVDRDGGATVGDSGFMVCNGPAFSPGGETMYFSDTSSRRILAYDVSRHDRLLRGRRLFARFGDDEGLPDGLTVDAGGDVWCAHYGAGRVTRFSPAGARKQVLHLPTPHVTSCGFGGPDLRTLYVTTGWGPGVTHAEAEPGEGGSLFAFRVDATGLPEPEFEVGEN